MSFSGALDAILAHLEGLAAPRFEYVEATNPISVPPGDRAAFVYYRGDIGLFDTLADSSIAERLMITCLWRPGSSVQVSKAIEVEMQRANRAIQRALKGDSQLGGNATDLKLGDTEAGYLVIGNISLRALSIPFDVWIYEAEPIAT